jgi:DNA-binding GntR family transcriptional regulator
MATRLNVRVNRKRPESMTRQIREQLNDLIDAGELAVGTLLPSERELANSLKVARNVVRGAYEQLMDAGKLRSEGRKGRSVNTSRGGAKKSKTSKSKSRKKEIALPRLDVFRFLDHAWNLTHWQSEFLYRAR